jgi:hypothetical protein
MEIGFVGWNAYSSRFVVAPQIEWECSADVGYYRVRIADRAAVIAEKVVKKPLWDLSDIWEQLPYGRMDLLIEAFDPNGHEMLSLHRQFRKSPGCDVKQQEPLDWREAILRNIAYLVEPAQDGMAEYEKGLPRFCWHSIENSASRQRGNFAFPALHNPSFIFAFLNYAELFPSALNAVEARKQAREYGDWLLKHRHPEKYVCSLFPFSTIGDGNYKGGCEDSAITLFRGARVGDAMLALYRAFKEEKYLNYARHLGAVFARLQKDDGSWPYRVNPETGEVKEEYTSSAIAPARFLEDLDRTLSTSKFAAVVAKAVDWTLNNPVRTFLWQGQYEDVSKHPPFKNLENWGVNETIRYLSFHAPNNAQYIEIARKLNAFIEDQFVLWAEEDGFVKCPTPSVLEQYACYQPMEVHTGNWLFSLLSLYERTHEESFLDRAVAAGNAIVRGQYRNGAFSTWGCDRRFGRPLDLWDWPGCNAVASSALMILQKYHLSLRGGGKCFLWEQRI